MKSSNKVKIGKILEAKGLRGEVKVLFFSRDSSVIDKVDSVFLAEKEFIIEAVNNTSKPDRLSIKFEGIDDRTAAEKLKGLDVSIEESALESAVGEEIYLREILGFEVYDETMMLGEVSGFESNGAQDILVVTMGEKKVLIPFVKEFIERIDFPRKTIFMKLPPGLLELEEK